MSWLKQLLCRHEWKKDKGWYCDVGWTYKKCSKCGKIKNYFRYARNNGCELIKCQDYKDGICHNEWNFVNKNTGEDMCPRNPDAISREEYEESNHE